MSELHELAHMPIPEMDPEDAGLLARMTECAYEALQTCQPPTWAEYFHLDWLERDAIFAARKRLRAEARQIAGFAVQSPLHAALAGADADGGAAAQAVFQEMQIAQELAKARAAVKHV